MLQSRKLVDELSFFQSDRESSMAGRLAEAVTNGFDAAAILTNDTDLREPVWIVTQEVGLPVTLLVPSSQPAASLAAVATHVRHIQSYLGPCLLLDPVTLADGRITAKPSDW